MKRLLACALLVATATILGHFLTSENDVPERVALSLSSRAPLETAGTSLETEAELVAIPARTPFADYDPLEVEAELDAIERETARTVAQPEPLPRPGGRAMDITGIISNPDVLANHAQLLERLVVDASNKVTIQWALDGNLLIASTVPALHEGLNSTEHAPGVPASQGFVAGGLKTGLWTTWHTSGEKESEGHYVYDQKHGSWTTWHASGAKASEGEYLYGAREGPWIEFHPDGVRLETTSYVHGRRDGRATTWHANGQRRSEAFNSFGRSHLEYREWHANGQRAAQGTYEYGTAVGRWQYWRADGTLDEERSGSYENGAKVDE